MSSISQRTRSKKAFRTLSEIDEVPAIKEEAQPPWIDSSFYEASGESIDDRLDNLTQAGVNSLSLTGIHSCAGSILKTAIHYPQFFAFVCITAITTLATAVSYAHPCDKPVRCYL